MRDFMIEIKTVNATETIAQTLKDEVFTRHTYNALRKENHLPAIEFARKRNIIKVVKEEPYQIERDGKTINAKRYYYTLDADKYDETMAFLQTRTGLRKRLKRCAMHMGMNSEKIKMLTDYNREIETFIELVGQW